MDLYQLSVVLLLTFFALLAAFNWYENRRLKRREREKDKLITFLRAEVNALTSIKSK